MSEPFVVACDVDGVIADLMPVWLNKYNAEFNDILVPGDIAAWDIEQFVKPECSKTKMHSYLRDPALYEQVQPVEGAQQGVKQLRSFGCRVIFATSCVKGMIDGKWAWLERYGFIDNQNFQPDLVVISDKGLLRADILIDDYPRNISAFRGDSIIFEQPWNKDAMFTNQPVSPDTKDIRFAKGWTALHSGQSPFTVPFMVRGMMVRRETRR